jgi:membrane protease YdiL (CAAX protease family)
MTDPTELVLTGGLAAALGLFAVAAWRRARSGESRLVAPGEGLAEATGGISPYESPAAVSTPTALPPEVPLGRVPVWFYRPADLIGVAIVFLVFAGLVLSALQAPAASPAALEPGVLLVNIGFHFMMAGVVTVFAIRRIGVVPWLGLRWPSWHWVFLIAPCSVLFMWAVFGGLQVSGYLKWMESLGVETVQDTVQLLRKSNDPLVLGLMAFAAVIAAPLCEEIVFRGYFYPVMKRFAGAWPAAICSAIVFSAAHGSLTAFLPLMLFGGLLVLIYEKTGSLWAPIAVHFCFNGATVVIQMAARIFDLPLESTP